MILRYPDIAQLYYQHRSIKATQLTECKASIGKMEEQTRSTEPLETPNSKLSCTEGKVGFLVSMEMGSE